VRGGALHTVIKEGKSDTTKKVTKIDTGVFPHKLEICFLVVMFFPIQFFLPRTEVRISDCIPIFLVIID
jgi:hypothetical protein